MLFGTLSCCISAGASASYAAIQENKRLLCWLWCMPRSNMWKLRTELAEACNATCQECPCLDVVLKKRRPKSQRAKGFVCLCAEAISRFPGVGIPASSSVGFRVRDTGQTCQSHDFAPQAPVSSRLERLPGLMVTLLGCLLDWPGCESRAAAR